MSFSPSPPVSSASPASPPSPLSSPSSPPFPVDPSLLALHRLARCSHPDSFPLSFTLISDFLSVREFGRIKRKKVSSEQNQTKNPSGRSGGEAEKRAKLRRKESTNIQNQKERDKTINSPVVAAPSTRPPFSFTPSFFSSPTDVLYSSHLTRITTQGRKTRRPKLVERCSSPSHFFIPAQEERRFGKEFEYDLPMRERLDGLLRGVAASFYYPKPVASEDQTKVEISFEHGRKFFHSIDSIQCPFRKRSPIEEWSLKEIALFESGIAAFGKDFHRIAKECVKTKATNQLVDFYYRVWKKSAHYQTWKKSEQKLQEVSADQELGIPTAIHVHLEERAVNNRESFDPTQVVAHVKGEENKLTSQMEE
jgi:hypothetical protein